MENFGGNLKNDLWFYQNMFYVEFIKLFKLNFIRYLSEKLF